MNSNLNNEVLYSEIDRRANMYEVGKMGLGEFENSIKEKSKSIACMMPRCFLIKDRNELGEKIYRLSHGVLTLSKKIMQSDKFFSKEPRKLLVYYLLVLDRDINKIYPLLLQKII